MKRFFLFLFGTLTPLLAFAQNGFRISNNGPSSFDCRGFVGCGEDGLVSFFVKRVLSLVLPINGVGFIFYVAVAVFLWGTLQMVLSRGEEMKESGKNAILYACLGLSLALVTSGVLSFICGYLFKLGGTSSTFCFDIWGQ
jgi:hypothetical protein